MYLYNALKGSGLEEEFYTASNTMIQRGIEAQRTYIHDQGILPPDTGTMVDLGTLVINSDTEIDSGDLDTMKRKLSPCYICVSSSKVCFRL